MQNWQIEWEIWESFQCECKYTWNIKGEHSTYCKQLDDICCPQNCPFKSKFTQIFQFIRKMDFSEMVNDDKNERWIEDFEDTDEETA